MADPFEGLPREYLDVLKESERDIGAHDGDQIQENAGGTQSANTVEYDDWVAERSGPTITYNLYGGDN